MDDREKRSLKKLNIFLLAFAVLLLCIGIILLATWIFGGKGIGIRDPLLQGFSQEDEEFHSAKPVTEYRFEVDSLDPLSSIPVFRNIVCTVVVNDSYNQSTFDAYILTSYDNKFHIKGTDKTVIYDGVTEYISSPVYTIKERRSSVSFEEEIGLITVEMLRERISANKSALTYSDDEKTVEIDVYSDSTEEHYTLDLLYGAVLNCRISDHGGKVLKSYFISDISRLNGENVNKAMFTIPD